MKYCKDLCLGFICIKVVERSLGTAVALVVGSPQVAGSPFVAALVAGSPQVAASVTGSPFIVAQAAGIPLAAGIPWAERSPLVIVSAQQIPLVAGSPLAVTQAAGILVNVNLPFGMLAAIRIKRQRRNLEEQHILEVVQQQ